VVGTSCVCEGCPASMWRRGIDGVVRIAPDAVLYVKSGDQFRSNDWLEGFVRRLDEAHAIESGHLTTYNEESVTAGECLDILDSLPPDAQGELVPYTPPGAKRDDLRSFVRGYQEGAADAGQFDWYLDPAFPVQYYEENSADDDLRAWLKEENSSRTAAWEDPNLRRPDEQFYDTYWGWWNDRAAYTGEDCPIVVMIGPQACNSWDGAHRLTIARLAQLRSAPVIVGIPKAHQLSMVSPVLYGGKRD
jgi:hypothetical protein